MKSVFKEGTLGWILYQSGTITERDIALALKMQKKTGRRFGETLVMLGIVRQEDIDWALSHQLDIPYARIQKESLDPAVLHLVPAAVARQYQLLPIVRMGNELGIAMADPLNKEAIAEVERVSGCKVSVSIGLLSEIIEMQDYFYGEADRELLGFSSSCFPPEELRAINGDGTGDALLDRLLAYLIRERLSSLSFSPLKERVAVSGRGGGMCRELGTLPPEHYEQFLATVRRKGGIITGSGLSSAGSFDFVAADATTPFQVVLMRGERAELMTLRPEVESSFPASIDVMEAPDRTRETLRRLAALPAGLVLCASPHAEERPRLVGACLDHCRGSGREVIFLGRGFSPWGDRYPVLPADCHDGEMARWIRAALLHDPAVVAAEEIADTSAFRAAFDAVLGGRLVFGGVAAPDIGAILRRVVHLRERLPMMGLSLHGAVACRGLRLLCPACKEEKGGASGRKGLPASAFRPTGCPACSFTGYAGRRYLVEAVILEGEAATAFDRLNGPEEVGAFLTRECFGGPGGIAAEVSRLLGNGEITPEEHAAVCAEEGVPPWPE